MKCWTCGSKVNTLSFKCPACKNLREMKRLNELVSAQATNEAERHGALERDLQNYFNELSDTVSAGLSNIATAIEWGFRDLSWRVEQQTEVLRSIDQTLKTPTETGANEFRQQAEKAKRLGALDVAQERYEMALASYPLDYRTYIGLAETYLQQENFEGARLILEKSLPFAPRGEIDYKSYSLRLTGHIHACKEDYGAAAEALREATELSPSYADAHYDYAQYCAQTGDMQHCLDSLKRAVDAKPLYWSLAFREQNFNPARASVDELLRKVGDEAARPAREAFDELAGVYDAVSRVCSSTPPVGHTYPSGQWQDERWDAHINALRELRNNGDLHSHKELARMVPGATKKLRNKIERGPLATAQREKERLKVEVSELETRLESYGTLGCFGLASLIPFFIVWGLWGLELAVFCPILLLAAGFVVHVGEKRSASKRLKEATAKSRELLATTINPLAGALKRLDALSPPAVVQKPSGSRILLPTSPKRRPSGI